MHIILDSNVIKEQENTTLQEQFKHPIKNRSIRGKIDTPKHRYMTAHFPGFLRS
jgi:hypothetical protein